MSDHWKIAILTGVTHQLLQALVLEPWFRKDQLSMDGSLSGGELKALLNLLQRFAEHDLDQFENLRLGHPLRTSVRHAD
jgi:hypothetical protein